MMRDINIGPCRWHMRIWDVENNEWLCENDKDALPYYGFDIRGGEVTAIQGMSWVYSAFAHGKEFIWEQSTGLKDKNGKEIYEGDIVKRVEDGGFDIVGAVEWSEKAARFWVSRYYYPGGGKWEVIGNIHENPELLEGRK